MDFYKSSTYENQDMGLSYSDLVLFWERKVACTDGFL